MKQHYPILLLLGLLLGIQPASAQSWGIGFRLGDPSGLTLKKYNGRKSFQLHVGRTRYAYKTGWYDKHFYKWYERQGFRHDDLQYDGYRTGAPIAVQFHILRQKSLEKANPNGGLSWYYGAGAQVRLNTIYYNYRFKPGNGSDWVYVDKQRTAQVDVGVDGVMGLEYTFKGPFALFLEANLYLEIVDAPFVLYTQGGFGLRYRF
jgi:hypothetical protein